LNYAIELEPLMQILRQYLIASDLAELEQTFMHIQARIRRFRQRRDRLGLDEME
jgi:hypothetical protein